MSAKGLKGANMVGRSKAKPAAAASGCVVETTASKQTRELLHEAVEQIHPSLLGLLLEECDRIEEKADTKLVPCPPVELTEEAEKPRVVQWSEFCEAIDLVGRLLDDYSGDVTGPGPSDLGTFIHNNGTEDDCCEAFLTLVPIARRIYERKKS